MTIVDTTVWVDFFRAIRTPETDWLRQHADQERLGLLDLMLCELLQGLPDEKRASAVLQELELFETLATGGKSLAIQGAANYRKLRARGRTVRKTIDCLIATYCLQYGHALLHNDRDFDPFEELLGLQVIHP